MSFIVSRRDGDEDDLQPGPHGGWLMPPFIQVERRTDQPDKGWGEHIADAHGPGTYRVFVAGAGGRAGFPTVWKGEVTPLW